MRSRLAELLNLTRPLIIFDYETTGIDPTTARAVSIGMKVHKPDGALHLYKTLINPEMPIPKGASEAHKITDDIIKHGCARCWAPEEGHPSEKCDRFRPVPTFAQFARTLHRGFQDADFSGYNVHYDLKVSAAEFGRNGLTFDYSKAYIVDPLRLWQVLEPRTLSDAVEYFCGDEVPVILNEQEIAARHFRQHAHDAMADVEATEATLIGQLTRHRNRSRIPRTVKEIHELCYPRDPNAFDSEGKFVFDSSGVLCFGFGKHKGKPVTAELGYVRWMQGNGFSPEVTEICGRLLGGLVPARNGGERPEDGA